MTTKPTLNWGILGTGFISTWFADDLLLQREDAKAIHNIVAVGARAVESATKFVEKEKLPDSTFVGSYDEVYANPNVDIVYLGIPHVFHRAEALKAIAHGKHVLVEKPATVNAKDFKAIVEAAEKKGVFVMEAMWLRFRPMILELQQLLLKDRKLGEIYRLITDFAMDMKIKDLPDDSRLKSNELGAGSLLDIGIYSLTYARVLLDDKLGKNSTPFVVKGLQTVVDGIDWVSTGILQYDNKDKSHAVFLCSVLNKTPDDFLRLEAEKGTVIISGEGSSVPSKYRIEYKDGTKVEKDFTRPGYGFYYEADAVALDIAAGKLQDDICPWDESILVLETMDELRKQGGVVYPQDK